MFLSNYGNRSGSLAEIKKKETCTVFLSSYTNTSGSLAEREMLWEHEPQTSVSSSPKLSRVFLYNSIETRSTCFLFPLENIATKKRKTTC